MNLFLVWLISFYHLDIFSIILKIKWVLWKSFAKLFILDTMVVHFKMYLNWNLKLD
jgi:hypothetical protein